MALKCDVCGREAKITKNGIDYCFGSHSKDVNTKINATGHTHIGGSVSGYVTRGGE